MAHDFGFEPSEKDFYFVSYCGRYEKPLGRTAEICRALNGSGVPLWYDRAIPYGSKYAAVISQHIADSRLMLLFVCPEMLYNSEGEEDSYVLVEFDIARRKKKKILPVFLGDIDGGRIHPEFEEFYSIVRKYQGIPISGALSAGTAALAITEMLRSADGGFAAAASKPVPSPAPSPAPSPVPSPAPKPAPGLKWECCGLSCRITGYKGSAAVLDIPAAIDGYPVTAIGESAFRDCKALTSVTLPDSVTTIGGKAFCGCENLADLSIPAGVTSIGESAFFACRSLQSVTIPASVRYLATGTFLYCTVTVRAPHEPDYYGYKKDWGVTWVVG